MVIRTQKYSFDVFDTLLTRIVASPVDIFLLVQRDLVGMKEIPEILKKKFVSARVWAEFKSRRLCGTEDVSLSAIYKVMERDYRLNPSIVQWLMTKELEMEERCITPINSQLQSVTRLHDDGQKVIFISDMYLPTDFIRAQLQRYGFLGLDDSLYVSGEFGLTKNGGKLYQYVLEKEGLEPGQLIHCGDNHHSDAIVPARMGIMLDSATRKLRSSGVGFTPGFRAKARYGASLLRARLDLGVNRVV